MTIKFWIIALTLCLVGWAQSGILSERSTQLEHPLARQTLSQAASLVYEHTLAKQIYTNLTSARKQFMATLATIPPALAKEAPGASPVAASSNAPAMPQAPANLHQSMAATTSPTPQPAATPAISSTPSTKEPTTMPQNNTNTQPKISSILTIGDSMMGYVASGLAKQTKCMGIKLIDAHKVSTGLVRNEYFDWPAELKSHLDKHNPSAVVVMLGANDAQDLKLGKSWIRFGSDAWKAEYTKRAAALAKIANSHKSKLVWIGQPNMNNSSFDAKMKLISGLIADLAPIHKFSYVSSAELISSGGYVKSTTIGKKRVVLRVEDGIHLTPAAGAIVASHVLTKLITVDQPSTSPDQLSTKKEEPKLL